MADDARRPRTRSVATAGWRTTMAILGLSLLIRIGTWQGGLWLYESFHTPIAELLARFPYALAAQIWANWDGRWYLSIARLGYQGRPLATAFFPGYPLLLAMAGGSVAAGILIASGAYIIGMVYLWQLVADRHGRAAAWYSIGGLAAFPYAFFFGAVYSESLYFALAAACLYYVGKRRYGWAAFTAAAASATSVYGLLLTPTLAMAMLRDSPGRRRWWLAFLVAPAGFLAYVAFLALRFGRPLLFDQVQIYWGRHPALPWIGLEAAARSAWQSRRMLTQLTPWQPISPAANHAINGLNFLVFVFVLGLWGASVADEPWEWRIYTVLGLLLPLLAPSRGEPLMSFPRLVLMVVPIWVGLGAHLAHHRGFRIGYLIAAVPFEIWAMARFLTFHWVA